MPTAEKLITDHLDTWSSTVKPKSTAGRGKSNGKQELYGIKKLRELILELAVRGLLVPQDSNDEPASELLERIVTTKTKPKKGASAILPSLENDPFKRPSGWTFTILDIIAEINGGFAFKSANYTSSGTRVIRISDFDENGFKNDRIVRHQYSDELSSFSLQENDILMAMTGGTVGKSLFVKSLPEPMLVNQRVATIRIHQEVSNSYINVLLKSNIAQEVIQQAKNSTNDNISMRDIKSFLIPLPPLAEQHRIVAKVDELMALCDQLEGQQANHLEANKMLVQTLLSALTQSSDTNYSFASAWTRIQVNFDTLFTTESSIDQLKQTILQLAVMGKLVPQDPNDEPASELLKKLDKKRADLLNADYPNATESKVQLRKQKKQKLPAALSEIPSGWQWATLMQASILVSDCHNKTAPYTGEGIRLIRTTNIRDGVLNFKDPKYVTKETYERWAARTYPIPGDILITREAPMGEACIIPDGEKLCMGQRMMLVRTDPNSIEQKYILTTFQSPDMMERVQDKPVGATVQHLRVGGVETMLLPIPPLAEQRRIVAKVDELMSLCDALKAKLQAAQTTQVQLTDTLVENAIA